NSSVSPKTIPPYIIHKLLGKNKVSNGEFTSHAWNAFAWSEDYNAETSWDDTNKIEGGSLKVSYTKPSTSTNMVTVGITEIGSLDSTKHYLLKFASAEILNKRKLGVYLQQSKAPFNKLTPVKYITLTASQEVREVLFSHPKAESNANIIIQLSDTDGPIWFDNIELHEVDVNITNPD